MKILRLKLNILIINQSQIPVISASASVKKHQGVMESQFIITYTYTWIFYYNNTF